MKPFTTEDFVRRIVGSTLRSGGWRGRVLCDLCLEKLAFEGLGLTFKKTDVHAALDAIRETPGALVFLREMPEDWPVFKCVSEAPPSCSIATEGPRQSTVSARPFMSTSQRPGFRHPTDADSVCKSGKHE